MKCPVSYFRNLTMLTAIWMMWLHGLPAQTWSTLTSPGGYQNRDEHGYVELNGKFYLLGGAYMGLPSVQVYDPVHNTWQNQGQVPIDFHHFQPVLHDGKIWIMASWSGGYTTEQNVANVWTFDPSGPSWQQGFAIPANRQRGSAGVVVYNDKFYILGGNSGGHGPQGDVKSWVDVYDPLGNGGTGSWTTLADMPIGRDHFHAVLVGDNIYVIGGRDSGVSGNFFATIRSQVDVYDIPTDTWTTLPSSADLPTLRAGACVAVVDNEILLMLGVGTSRPDEKREVEAFNTITQTWRSLPQPQHSRSGTQAVQFGDNSYVASGRGDHFGGTWLNDQEKLYFASTFPSVTNPADVVTTEGNLATFLVSASGAQPITYQWQLNTGTGWTDIPGGTQYSYTTPQTVLAMDGYQYRCRVNNSYGTIVSSPGTLSVLCDGFFLETGGTVVMEVENFSDNISRSGKTWNVIQQTGGVGSSVQPMPNTGVIQNTGYAAASPELQYEIDFSQSGTYYIWVRMYALGGGDDSAHGGIDGNEDPNCDRITANNVYTAWHWTQLTMDNTSATVNVPTAGLHTFNLWMREDGVIIDRLLLTTDPSFVPSGNGPTESSRCSGSSPFPVELSHFGGYNQGGIHMLEWTTERESHNDYFSIEKSNDGNSWQPITQIPSPGNSDTTRQYRYKDESPYPGDTYYRLKQVDLDGQFTYSQVLVLKFNEIQKYLAAFPNPVEDGPITIKFSHLAADTRIQVMNASGQLIFQKSYGSISTGHRSEKVDLSNQVPGIYYLQLKTSQEILSKKIMVK